MATLREKQKEMTINLILDAVDELFHMKGFDDVRTAEIAERAGVSEGTLYNYFSSKSDMMLKMVEKKVYKEGNQFVEEPTEGVDSNAGKFILEASNRQWGWASKVQRSHLRKVFSEFITLPIHENEIALMVSKNDAVYKQKIHDILLDQDLYEDFEVELHGSILFDCLIMSMQNYAIIETMDAEAAWNAYKAKVCVLLNAWGYE